MLSEMRGTVSPLPPPGVELREVEAVDGSGHAAVFLAEILSGLQNER